MRVVKITKLGYFKNNDNLLVGTCDGCYFTRGGLYCLLVPCAIGQPYVKTTEEDYLLARLRGEAYDVSCNPNN